MRVGVKVTRSGTTPTQAAYITQDKIRAVSRVTTEQVWAPAARRRCPRRTGRLRRSIKWRLVTNKRGLVQGSVFPTARSRGKPYGLFVEWGTRNIRVGTPKRPRKRWAALAKRGEVGSPQRMPFVRAAWKLDTEKVYRLVLKQSLNYKKRIGVLLPLLRKLARQVARASA